MNVLTSSLFLNRVLVAMRSYGDSDPSAPIAGQSSMGSTGGEEPNSAAAPAEPAAASAVEADASVPAAPAVPLGKRQAAQAPGAGSAHAACTQAAPELLDNAARRAAPDSGPDWLARCIVECGADAALMDHPDACRTASALEWAANFDGLRDVVLRIIRLCLCKVNMACKWTRGVHCVVPCTTGSPCHCCTVGH